jgi:4-amino-4-deoxy-L-arabinose transferase-like glycosyltransferase
VSTVKAQMARRYCLSPRSRPWVKACALALLAALGIQIAASVRTWSPTFDEPYHILRAYVYLKTGDSALLEVGGHPPFSNLLSVAPLLLRSDVILPPHQAGWPNIGAFSDLFSAAEEFFWRLGNDADGILIWSRLPGLCLSLCLAGLVFLWAKERNGPWAGLLALALYAFDPNLIAHSSVVTTDLGATFLIFATVYCLWRFCRRPSWSALALTGVAFGLAQASKFSCLFLAPAVAVTLAIWSGSGDGSTLTPPFAALKTLPGQGRGPRRARLRRLCLVLGLCLIVFLIGFTVLWAVYGFRVRPLLPHESTHAVLDRWIPGDSVKVRHIAYKVAENLLIPAPAYFDELAWLQRYSKAGHSSYLLGQYRRSGWWYYFPVAFAVKTPVPTLLLLLLAFYLSLRHRGEEHDEYFLLAPMAVFFGASVFSSIDIGYRNILPVLPLAYVYVSKLAAKAFDRPARVGLAVLCLWLVTSTVRVSPHYLAYFNELAGGPGNGSRYLADSNLDWGQDLKNLKRYMDARGIPELYLDYFGVGDPNYYGIRSRQVPNVPPLADAVPAYYAVSVTSLVEVYAPGGSALDWIRQHRPVDNVGYSIFVYRLPD